MKSQILWHQIVLAIALPLFLGTAIWWLESRFDAGIAILVLGLALGVGLYVFGNVSGRRDTITTVKETMTAMSDHTHEVGRALELRAKAEGTIAVNENRMLVQRERDAAQWVDRQVNQRVKQLTVPADDLPVWEQANQRTAQPAQQNGFAVYD